LFPLILFIRPLVRRRFNLDNHYSTQGRCSNLTMRGKASF
jgi:hypothetical protein